jgi:hypothetical protein
VVIDLQNTTYNGTPRVIIDLYATVGDSLGRPSSLGCLFVQEGPMAGKIVLTQYLGDRTWVQLLDPPRTGSLGGGTRLIAKATVDDERGFKNWLADPAPDGSLQVLGQESRSSGEVTTTLSIVTVNPGTQATLREMAVPTGSVPVSVKRLKAAGSWATMQYAPDFEPGVSDRDSVITVYTAQGMQTGVTISPTVAYTQSHDLASNLNGTDSGIVLGEGLFAYVQEGQLHVRGYDGVDDLVLETGVQTIFAGNQLYNYWSFVRR